MTDDRTSPVSSTTAAAVSSQEVSIPSMRTAQLLCHDQSIFHVVGIVHRSQVRHSKTQPLIEFLSCDIRPPDLKKSAPHLEISCQVEEKQNELLCYTRSARGRVCSDIDDVQLSFLEPAADESDDAFIDGSDEILRISIERNVHEESLFGPGRRIGRFLDRPDRLEIPDTCCPDYD